MDLDETTFIARLRRGDDDAFTTLVQQHGSRLLATARRILHSDEDAKDALQEAFVSAARAIDGFEGGARLSTWLHRIVINTALMKLRSRRRRAEEPIDLLPRFDAEGYHAAAVSTWETSSDVLLERRETRVMVRQCIDGLPERYRTVLLLRDIEELDTQETADLLRVTANTVKIRLHRARQALRTLLERELVPRESGSRRACA